VGLCGAPSAASAATIAPTTFADDFTNNSVCSLREAISIANTDSTATEPDCPGNGTLGDDLIELHMEGQPYILDIAGSGDNSNATGDLDVDTTNGDLRIDGIGAAGTTIDTDDSPAWADRVIHHATGAGTLEVTFLTLTGGNVTGGGGAILAAAGATEVEFSRLTGNASTNSAGGIRAEAPASSLSILESTIFDNATTGASGGGVLSAIATTIDSSSIAQNSVTAGVGQGGGLSLAGTGDKTITDSQIAANFVLSTGMSTARGGGISVSGAAPVIRGTSIFGNQVNGGTTQQGGGIYVASGSGGVTLVNSTLATNMAVDAGGSGAGLYFEGTVGRVIQSTFNQNQAANSPSAVQGAGLGVQVKGSVIETNGALDACAGTITSQGFNVFTDSSCGTLATGDEADADPMLANLHPNGTGVLAGAPGFQDSVLTQMPADASTVIDHVPADECDDDLAAPLLLDQRGEARPFESDGDGVAECEAGSVESHVAPPALPPPGGGNPSSTPVQPAGPVKKRCKKGRKLKKGKCVKKKRKKR
jgi:CSLREA domain-containing protein